MGDRSRRAGEVVVMAEAGKRLLYWSPLNTSSAQKDGEGDAQHALSMHLIPSFILVLILILVLFAAAALWYTVGHPNWILTIAGPLFMVAALFLTGWVMRRELRARH